MTIRLDVVHVHRDTFLLRVEEVYVSLVHRDNTRRGMEVHRVFHVDVVMKSMPLKLAVKFVKQDISPMMKELVNNAQSLPTLHIQEHVNVVYVVQVQK